MTTPRIHPRLVVRDAPAAIDFYRHALGAEELSRFTTADGSVVDAQLQVGDDVFSLTEESEYNAAPPSLGGSPLILALVVADADATGAAMEAHGAEVVFPIADQFYGKREGRLRDPFGHLWIVSQDGGDLPAEEIHRRLDEAGAG